MSGTTAAAPGPSPVTPPPGLHPDRLLRLVRRAIAECELDLDGATVLTEAATGAYVVTPVVAALGGAKRVLALSRDTCYGSVADVTEMTFDLATRAGVADRIEIVTEKTEQLVGAADIITNSGHLRPLDAEMIGWMRRDAVVPLMFEAWELDAGRFDVDVDSLRERGVRAAGTNERNPAVDVFNYLGPMAVKQLTDAAVAVRHSRVLVLCDNPFADFLRDGLRSAGADVEVVAVQPHSFATDLDAVVVALRPTGGVVFGEADARRLGDAAPGAVVTQFWGDIDRDGLARAGVSYWPAHAPSAGHMGVLPSALGPEAIVRLQAGGLKVGAVLRKAEAARTPADVAFLDEL
ncbi:MAG: hypothetical protein ACXW2C_02950 [Acidimicrobiia bacterium]